MINKYVHAHEWINTCVHVCLHGYTHKWRARQGLETAGKWRAPENQEYISRLIKTFWDPFSIVFLDALLRLARAALARCVQHHINVNMFGLRRPSTWCAAPHQR